MIETQKFKGDSSELRMEAAALQAMDACGLALDTFFDSAFTSNPFLLMLYDQGLMPFSERVPRAAFVDFMIEAIRQFPFTGSFDSYLFMIEAIFGEGSSVLFNIPAAGKLEMLVNAASSIPFDWVARELVVGAYQQFEMLDSFGNQIEFRGISGISSEYQLSQLLAEIIPAGIFPDVTLAFFSLYSFYAQDGGEYFMVDHLGNQIVFIETGA